MISDIFVVEDPSQTSAARRRARQLAEGLEFAEGPAEKVAIVVTEICTNLLKHAGGGTISMSSLSDQNCGYVEIVAFDNGPGIADLAGSARDGVSTAGTPGTGLGAIARMSSNYEIYTLPGKGTAMVSRICAAQKPQETRANVRGVQTICSGEVVCGDAWTYAEDGDRTVIMVADGLGHGSEAAIAANRAVESVHKYRQQRPAQLLETIHLNLASTRGAAVAVAELNRRERSLRFAGLGNIAASICTPSAAPAHLISMHGTAGSGGKVNLREFTYPMPANALLVMHSDGVSARWNLPDYPGLIMRDLSLVASVLLRDFGRSRDDATVVVAK